MDQIKKTQPKRQAPGICEHCGAKFKRKAFWQKFCSTACRTENFYKRKYAPGALEK